MSFVGGGSEVGREGDELTTEVLLQFVSKQLDELIIWHGSLSLQGLGDGKEAQMAYKVSPSLKK